MGPEFSSTMSYIRNQLLASMDLGSSSGISSVAVHGGILRQDAGVMLRYVNPGVVFEDVARHGRDEIDLDEMQNAAEQEKHDIIDLNDPPGMDSDEDTLQQLTDGATNHNGQLSGNDANENATTLVDEPDEDISSQPIVPFVGMLFDNVEEAQRVYNEYALKIGFGTRIVTSRHSRTRASEKKGILIYRVF
ncbi:far-red impaired response protein-like [Hordeum vulgare]|nr:far-red impaired response protein-like [Hordeum vulgare]